MYYYYFLLFISLFIKYMDRERIKFQRLLTVYISDMNSIQTSFQVKYKKKTINR